jgi:hypothetical protein
MSTEPTPAAPSPAPLSPRDRLLAILPWWFWPAGLVAFFVPDLRPLARRHALWALGGGFAFAMALGCCPFLVAMIAEVSGSEALRSLAILLAFPAAFVNRIVDPRASLLWTGAALLNTCAALRNKGPRLPR